MPAGRHWPEVYKKVSAAGKKIQAFEGFDALDAVISQTGAARPEFPYIDSHMRAQPMSTVQIG